MVTHGGRSREDFPSAQQSTAPPPESGGGAALHPRHPPPWKFVWAGLSAISVVLVIISVLVTTVVLGTVPEDRGHTIRGYFEVDSENNLPAWWSSFMLLSSGTLLFYAAALWRWSGWRGWWRWVAIGLVLTAMSLDEATRIHERLGRLYRMLFGEAPLDHYTWLMLGVPVAVAVIIFLAVMIRGMPGLPRTLLFCGVVVFLAGAVGMEIIQSLLMDRIGGEDSWGHFALWHIEELIEMLGAGLMVAAAVSAVHDGLHRYCVAREQKPREAPTQ